jgi:hypothetical protein
MRNAMTESSARIKARAMTKPAFEANQGTGGRITRSRAKKSGAAPDRDPGT